MSAVGINTRHLRTGDVCPKIAGDVFTFFNMRFCPFAQRTALVLKAKNIPFTTVNLNLKAKPEWYFSKHPLGTVPALQKGDDVIIESLICSDYLDERFPDDRGLHPSNKEKKFTDIGLVAIYGSKVLPNVYKVYKADVESLESALSDLRAGLAIFEKELASRGTKFLGGEKPDQRPGMLDYMIWPWIERFGALEIIKDTKVLPKETFPKLLNWIAAMTADPTVAWYLLSSENHAKFIRGFLSDNIDYDFLVES